MTRNRSPRARNRKQLARKRANRASYDRILIVSEGSKTEPNYFTEIRQEYRLHTANVEVHPSKLGTAPIQVVQYAEQLFRQGDKHRNIEPRAFEQVYAVFDRDEHSSYFEALNKAKALDKKLRNDNKQLIRFQAVASVPCFELWLLLHYEEVHQSLQRQDVIRRLKKHIPDYEKGSVRIFTLTKDKLAIATQRAQALAKKFSAHSEPEPFTAIVELVSLLTQLRS